VLINILTLQLGYIYKVCAFSVSDQIAKKYNANRAAFDL